MLRLTTPHTGFLRSEYVINYRSARFEFPQSQLHLETLQIARHFKRIFN